MTLTFTDPDPGGDKAHQLGSSGRSDAWASGPAPGGPAGSSGYAAPPSYDAPPAGQSGTPVSHVALAAAGATVAAVIVWFLWHGWSLFIDVALTVWVASTATMGLKGGKAGDRIFSLARLPGLPVPTLRAVIGLAVAPFAVGVIIAVASGLHHSSRADVCSALSGYQSATASSENSTSVFDNAWFDALTKVGNTAADYAGPDQAAVTAAGHEAASLAAGSGNSSIVTVSVGQADSALAPVFNLCGMAP